MPMQPFTGTFPAGMSEDLKAYFMQRLGDNYAFCYQCNQPVWQSAVPSECMECTPPQSFTSLHAHYIAEIATAAAAEATAIAAAAAPAPAPSATTTTPSSQIMVAVNNLFTNHLDAAMAAEAAHWSSINTSNASAEVIKSELNDIYKAIPSNPAGGRSAWLNKIRNKHTDKEKLDEVMDIINNA